MHKEIRIKKVFSASVKDWDRIWGSCDYATYFHSREWAEIWKFVSGGNSFPDPRMVLFSDGKKAIIPLFCIKERLWGLAKEYISSPEGTYGGWVSSDDLQIEHARLLADYMMKYCANIYWRVNPYDKFIFKTGIKPTNEVTHALNLLAGFEDVIKRFSRGNVSTIHKAQRNGIVFREASTIEDWQDYFKIYESSLARWGDKVSSRYDWKLFEEFFHRRSAHIHLWLALHEGIIISGGLCFYSKTHVVGWHGVSLKEYSKYSPFNFLNYEIIKDACQKGYTWFDFNPSGGHEGVVAWKESFGTQTLNCPVICTGNRATAFYNRIADLIGK